MLFLCVAVLAFISFSIRSFGYGFFTLVMTPLFMVLLDLANPGDWKVSLFRILDTLAGGVLALIGGYTLFPIWERERLPLQLARTLLAIREYFDKATASLLREEHSASGNRTIKTSSRSGGCQRHDCFPEAFERTGTCSRRRRTYTQRGQLCSESFLAIGAIDEHFHEFPAGGEWKEIGGFANAVSDELNNLAHVLQSNAALKEFPDLDHYVDELGEEVERLSEARFGEFSADGKREVTSTLLALREHSVVHVQIKRIASHLRILQNSVARLKGLPAEVEAG